MAVLGGDQPGREVDAHLDDLAPRGAQVVPHEISALESGELRLRHVQSKAAYDNQQRYCHDSSRVHVNVLSLPILRKVVELVISAPPEAI
jgi:hypothetical protein